MTATMLPAHPTQALRNLAPRFSDAERDRRWTGFRAAMREMAIDAAIFIGSDYSFGGGLANLRYMLQAASQVACAALFPESGTPVVWSGPSHMNRPYNFLRSTSTWVQDIRDYGGIEAVVDEARRRGLGHARIGIVSSSSAIFASTLLASDERLLKTELPGVAFVDMNPALERLRLIKSEEEIAMLRRAGKIARQVLDVAMESIRPGVTEAEVFADMEWAKVAYGAEPDGFNLLASGPVDHARDEEWHLLHGLDQPSVPSLRPLADGDILISEWHTRYAGYNTHSEYTFFVGRSPPQQLSDIFKVCVESLDAAQEVLRPGMTMRDAVTAIRAPAQRAGLDWIELGLHGHGLISPEFPAAVLPDSLTHPGAGDLGDLVLTEGMCFGTNHDLHNRSWKRDVGCVLGGTFIVRPTGGESLVDLPRQLGLATAL